MTADQSTPGTEQELAALNAELRARHEAVRKTVTVTVLDEAACELAQTLADVVSGLSEVLEKVPAEYRSVAAFSIDAEEGLAWIRVTYKRPETDAERDARRCAALEMTARAELRERAELKRLQAKFGETK